MKFGNLIIENFLTVTAATVALSDRGLVLVQGVNKDDTSASSNGAGKSSVFDALCWCLFNETARGESGDDVINWKAGKGTKVSVEVFDGSDHYVISRHRKHKTDKNRLTLERIDTAGTAIDLTDGTDKMTQEKVTKLIGSSLEVFVASIYAGQDKMPDLPAMTDKNLKLVVEEAAGIMLIEEASAAARKRLAAKKAERDALGMKITSLADQVAGFEDAITQAETDGTNWEASRALRAKNYVDQAQRAKKELDESKATRALVDLPALEAEIAEVDAKIKSVETQNAELARLGNAVATAEAKAASLRRDAEAIKAAHERQQKVIADVQHRVGCPCDSCGREITVAEIAASETAEKAKLATLVEDFKKARDAFQLAQKDAQKLAGEHETFRESMTDLSAEIASARILAARKNDVEQLDRTILALTNAVTQSADQARAVRAEVNPFKAPIERARTSLEAKKKDHADEIKRLDALTEEVEIAESVVQVFGPAGVRAHILDEVTPFLNAQTAKYLAPLSDGNIEATWTTLTAGSKGELKEKFSIEVENAHGGKKFGLQSGGEKRKVRIAAALALQDLVARRAAKPIDLFIGDEIDNALDAPGLERLTTLLEEKAKERGSVFVISHSNLKDWISQVMTVTKEGGKTTIKEEMV